MQAALSTSETQPKKLRRLKSMGLKRAFLTMHHVLNNLLPRFVSLLETSADGKNKQKDMIVIEIDARVQRLPKYNNSTVVE